MYTDDYTSIFVAIVFGLYGIFKYTDFTRQTSFKCDILVLKSNFPGSKTALDKPVIITFASKK
jgi:hypothetical protein